MMTNKEKLREALRFNTLPVVLHEAAERAEQQAQAHANDMAFEQQLKSAAYEDKTAEWKRAERAELMRNIWCGVACISWFALLYLIYSAR